jgi:hypothetical protein
LALATGLWRGSEDKRIELVRQAFAC